jgi:chemotaxis protein MotB
MAAHRKKKRHDDHGDHPDERWLVTYADLMTLLVALFMVLFSISSVNKSKFETLQASLQDAFSGRILPGGKSIKEAGGTDNQVNPSPQPPESNLQPFVGGRPSDGQKTGGPTTEEHQFQKLKKQIDKVVAAKGLSGKVSTKVTPEGLQIRLLTDDLLFDSGSAVPRPASVPLLDKMASLLGTQPDHQLIIAGNTDSVPVNGGTFIDNLQLSTDRAGSIYRVFAHEGLSTDRMTAAGRGDAKPVAPNTTAAGRSLNRRVEILVPRTGGVPPATAAGATPKIPSIKPSFSPQTR